MKKAYSAPDITFEDFSLSMNISAGCEKIVTTLQQFSCAVNYPMVGMIFTDAVEACKIQITDGSAMGNYYCYHVPTDDKNVFTS